MVAKCAQIAALFETLESVVFLGSSSLCVGTHRGHASMTTDPTRKTAATLKRSACGFKSCTQDSSAAIVAAIQLLLKGFAGARSQLYLEFTRTAV